MAYTNSSLNRVIIDFYNVLQPIGCSFRRMLTDYETDQNFSVILIDLQIFSFVIMYQNMLAILFSPQLTNIADVEVVEYIRAHFVKKTH